MAEINNVRLGDSQVDKIYVGDTLVWRYEAPDTIAPTTTIYPPVATTTFSAGQKIWLEVDEACNTYYTLDGSTPTTASTKFTEAITLNGTTTIKYFSVDLAGNVEAFKTTTIEIIATPVTTISPSQVVQNNIPITVTLTATGNPTATYYKIGSGTTVYTYTSPFTVSQNTAGVGSTQIKITFWSVNAEGTEPEKIITYDTSGALPSEPVVTATAGQESVSLSWTASTNTTAYTVYRSTVAGQMGTWIGASQYLSASTLSMVDTGLTAGTTYYYQVRAGNYSLGTYSAQVSAIPTAPPVTPTKPTFRYIRIDGYGEWYTGTSATTTRMIEVEIFSGGVNRMAGKIGSTDDSVDFGTDVGSLAPPRITDGVKGITGTTYNGWWGATTNNGNGWVKFDLGQAYAIDSIRYWSYTSRSPRFKIWGSNNLADFGANGALGAGATLIWDESLNDGIKTCGATAGVNNYIEEIF